MQILFECLPGLRPEEVFKPGWAKTCFLGLLAGGQGVGTIQLQVADHISDSSIHFCLYWGPAKGRARAGAESNCRVQGTQLAGVGVINVAIARLVTHALVEFLKAEKTSFPGADNARATSRATATRLVEVEKVPDAMTEESWGRRMSGPGGYYS